eukprot:TRINITY_DN1388_c0_g1_i1.p1 TRINITY_DN1388_c0_g1~~TRINITY_DN1388_c0_g1_i1.p1  ORF type:complete len:377 (+),score=80.51 TRINITY_DN1388_c0_g1_i1:45-1133(+)
MKRKCDAIEIEDLDDDVQLLSSEPTQQDDMKALYESVRSALGVGCVNKLWGDKGFQNALNSLIRHERRRNAKRVKVEISVEDEERGYAQVLPRVIAPSSFRATIKMLQDASWGTDGNLPPTCKHLLVLDLENIYNFFPEIAGFEVERQLEVIPENCYVFAAWGAANRMIPNKITGHVAQHLIETNRLKCDFSGTTPNAADTIILSTMVDLLMGGMDKKIPITLVSSDKDFNELHVMATAYGYSYNRILSMDDDVIWDNPTKSKEWIATFCTQLRSRLNTRSNRKTLPQSDEKFQRPLDGNYKLNFLSQTSIHRQLALQGYFSDPNSGAEPKRENRNKYPPNLAFFASGLVPQDDAYAPYVRP